MKERILLGLALALGLQAQGGVGLFEGHGDVGAVLHAGSAEYDLSKRAYTLSGSGENMWGAADAFHFAWIKASGDVSVAADVAMPGQGGDPHRKAVLMIRQSLDADSAYADAALHGDGLISLQSRDEKGAATHEVQSNRTGARRLRIEKRGQYVYMSVTGDGGALTHSGATMRVPLQGEFYVGIGVCAHNKDAVEKAVFTDVQLVLPTLYSSLETITVASTDRRVTYVTRGRVESPTWVEGDVLVFGAGGKTMRVPVAGGRPEPSDPAPAVANAAAAPALPDDLSNFFPHVSPDGRQVVFLSYEKGAKSPPKDQEVTLRVMNLSTKAVRTIAKLVGGAGTIDLPSWSPDSRRLAFVSYQYLPMQR